MRDDELEKLLRSISTHDPKLKVHGVVKTPDVEGKITPKGEVLPDGVKESELPPPLLGEPREVDVTRVRWRFEDDPVPDEHAPMKEPQKKIYRDDIARFKKAGIKAPYKKLAGLINHIPIGKVTDEMIRALKQRLQRSSRAK
jgi:hypothetical protein